MIVVEVDGLHVAAGDRDLVDGVSFTLAEGRVLALVGESGSGKTSTALALLGETRPGTTVTGTVVVDGAVVTPGHPFRPGVVGYVPQHPGAVLHPVRRVGSLLRETARRHLPAGARRTAVDAAVHDALRRAQVADPGELLGRFRHQLSGGQQQRVVLAQALLCAPRVLVADEPTTGQDAPTRRRVAGELAAVASEGVAVVLLTHDLDLVRALAHGVVVLRRGAVVESGPAAQVLDAPRADYTRALVAARDTTPPEATAGSAGRAVLTADTVVADHRARGTSRRALHGVSLALEEGRRVALVGRSGSGKTTLARVLAGLHPPAQGSVRLHGRDLPGRLTARPRTAIAAVQYVFQDARASFDVHRSVVDQVARTALLLRPDHPDEPRDRALAGLARVGLPADVVTRRPGSLSGGELQRAALARALLAEPEVLVCDEVTSGLDTLTRTAVCDLLADLADEAGCALLMIAHDAAVVARLADEVLVLEDGRVIEHGTTAEVLGAPRHELTRALLGTPEPATRR